MRRARAVIGVAILVAGTAACTSGGGPEPLAYVPVDRHVTITLFKKHANNDKCDSFVSESVHVVEGDSVVFDVMNLCDSAQTVQVAWAGSGSNPNDSPSSDAPSGSVPADQSIVPLKAAIRRDAADHGSNQAKPKTYHYRLTLTGSASADPDIVVDPAP